MLALPSAARIFFFKDAIDLRRGFESLSSAVEDLFKGELTSGAFFVFLNSRRNRMKVLYWDSDGLVIWFKRLEGGTFSKSSLEEGLIDRRSFLMLLEGVKARRMLKRYALK
jgi:transposase